MPQLYNRFIANLPLFIRRAINPNITCKNTTRNRVQYAADVSQFRSVLYALGRSAATEPRYSCSIHHQVFIPRHIPPLQQPLQSPSNGLLTVSNVEANQLQALFFLCVTARYSTRQCKCLQRNVYSSTVAHMSMLIVCLIIS